MIWQTILISAVVFGVALVGMAIGVIVSNRRLRGSCGGLANMKDSDGNTLCDLCTHPSADCDGDPEKQSQREVETY